MKFFKFITLLGFFLGLAACVETSDIRPASKLVPPPDNPKVRQLLNLINEERTKRNLRPLSSDPKLTKAAKLHAKEQMAENHLDHKSLNGDSVSDRVSQAGYSWSFVAENLAAGRETASETVIDWINSLGHNKNLFTKSATEFGAAYVSRPRIDQNDLGHFWVLVLAAPLN